MQKSNYLCSMKKMISTQGLSNGDFYDENIASAIKERICPRLEHFFCQMSGEEVHINVTFSFYVSYGEVEDIYIRFFIDNPTQERLENFHDVCEMFFGLIGFIVHEEDPIVFYYASDMYDKGCLIQALDMLGVSLESVMCATFEENIESENAIYTPSGGTIVQVPNVPKYRIQEGTMWMAPNALQNCPRLRQLDIPFGMINHLEILKSAPKVKYKEWETLYDGTLPDEEDDEEDDDFILDEHQVAYSKDGKRLLFARIGFHEPRYEVRQGSRRKGRGSSSSAVVRPMWWELSIPLFCPHRRQPLLAKMAVTSKSERSIIFLNFHFITLNISNKTLYL